MSCIRATFLRFIGVVAGVFMPAMVPSVTREATAPLTRRAGPRTSGIRGRGPGAIFEPCAEARPRPPSGSAAYPISARATRIKGVLGKGRGRQDTPLFARRCKVPVWPGFLVVGCQTSSRNPSRICRLGLKLKIKGEGIPRFQTAGNSREYE